MNIPKKQVIRVLLYEGSETWINNTMERNAVQGGVFGKGPNPFTIQEVVLPGWLSWILTKIASRQPMAYVGFKTDYREGQ
jgi:hypothetical protein